MDVRCEKCQTEYELDEARLKPGGVTVKCTNCGHMFKIRKRSTTNVGAPPPTEARERSGSAKVPATGNASRADSVLGDEVTKAGSSNPSINEDPTDVRQWLIRLENGDQKSCRELATLQQWIVAGVVTRESLISRSGKTWKRLGDIVELSQYFTVADEARTVREDRTTKPTGRPAVKEVQSTMLGIGASAAGGTILPDDDDDDTRRSTGNFKARGATNPPPIPSAPSSTKTPPHGSGIEAPTTPQRRPLTQPPPPPAKKTQSNVEPLPSIARPNGPSVPAGNRSTAAWATEGQAPAVEDGQGPSGPFGGRINAPTDDPVFAGRVRVMPSDEAGFQTGKVGKVRQGDDDDDDVLPGRRGSRGGMWILLMALLVMGAAAAVVYVFVIRKPKGTEQATKPVADAAVVAIVAADAAPPVVTPVIDAPAAPTLTPLELARAELPGDNEPKLRDALKSIEANQEPAALALRAHLAAAIAQGLTDRAAIITSGDKAEADKLKKDAKTLMLEPATWAQKAVKAAPSDPAANLAMAEVLRLQGKPMRDVKRYLETAKGNAGDWKTEIALAEALLLARDGKLDDAKAALTALDQGDGKLETGDVRARLHLALVAYAQNKPTDAKPLVDQVLGAQPDHATAKALAARLETTVAKTDPLPPEDGPRDAGAGSAKVTPPPDLGGGGDSYDRLLAKANALAESNCGRAMDLFSKALDQKPNGVEALTGMGYCHIDAKQFASAFSKFRAALAVSSKYEPALWGVGEAYQQQGRKEQAIEAFKAYLEVYPSSAKAQKRIDQLTGGASTPPTNGSGAPTNGSAEPPTPTPTPTPTPVPTPPAGSGSG